MFLLELFQERAQMIKPQQGPQTNADWAKTRAADLPNYDPQDTRHRDLIRAMSRKPASAFKKGQDWTLTKQYLWCLYLAQDGRCALTGVPMHGASTLKKARDQEAKDKELAAKPATDRLAAIKNQPQNKERTQDELRAMVFPKPQDYNYATDPGNTLSLDRISSDRGYVPGNVQFITLRANKAKRDMPEKEFVKLCRDVAAHYSEHKPHPQDFAQCKTANTQAYANPSGVKGK